MMLLGLTQRCVVVRVQQVCVKVSGWSDDELMVLGFCRASGTRVCALGVLCVMVPHAFLKGPSSFILLCGCLSTHVCSRVLVRSFACLLVFRCLSAIACFSDCAHIKVCSQPVRVVVVLVMPRLLVAQTNNLTRRTDNTSHEVLQEELGFARGCCVFQPNCIVS